MKQVIIFSIILILCLTSVGTLNALPGSTETQIKKLLKQKNIKFEPKNFGSKYRGLEIKNEKKLGPAAKRMRVLYFSYRGKIQAVRIWDLAQRKKPLNANDRGVAEIINKLLGADILRDFKAAKLAYKGPRYISDRYHGNWIPPGFVYKINKIRPGDRLVKYEKITFLKGKRYAYEIVHELEYNYHKIRIWSHNSAAKFIKIYKFNAGPYATWMKSKKNKPLKPGSVQHHSLKDKNGKITKNTYSTYMPPKMKLNQKKQVLFIFHGDGGRGSRSIKGWIPVAKKLNLFLIAPSFNYDMYGGKLENDEYFPAILKEVERKTSIKHKVFITSFSSGGGYAHSFARTFNDRIAAVAMHSSGAIGGVMMPDAYNKNVSVLVTCGLKGPYCGNSAAYIQAAKKLRFRRAEYHGAKSFRRVRRASLVFFRRVMGDIKNDPAPKRIKNVSPEALVGKYQKQPAQNSWHSGHIRILSRSKDNAVLEWKNKAGVTWKLYWKKNNLSLRTGKGNPYYKNEPETGRAFKVRLRSNGRTINGFAFLSEFYEKIP